MESLSGKDAQELGTGLYNSQRDYLEQLEALHVEEQIELFAEDGEQEK